MNWNNLIILMLVIFGFLIMKESIKLQTLKQCQKPVIQYKYLPRTFEEEQQNPITIEKIFNKMFAYPSPWMISRNIGIKDKREDTNLKM